MIYEIKEVKKDSWAKRKALAYNGILLGLSGFVGILTYLLVSVPKC